MPAQRSFNKKNDSGQDAVLSNQTNHALKGKRQVVEQTDGGLDN